MFRRGGIGVCSPGAGGRRRRNARVAYADSDPASRAAVLGCRRPGRRRHRRGGPGRVGGPGHGGGGRPPARASARCARLEGADTRRTRGRGRTRARGGPSRSASATRRYEECDDLGMTAALRAAGRRALAQLAAHGYEPDRIILDGNHDYLALGARSRPSFKGDTTSLSVAAASCVAKVTRDALDARRRPSTTRRTTSSRTSGTRRRSTSRRWRGTARARSTGARGSSWTACAGGACRRRRAGCSEQGDEHGIRSARGARPRAGGDPSVRRRRRRRPVEGRVAVRGLGRARAREPHRQRELLGRGAGAGQDHRGGRRPSRRRRARRRSAAAYDDSAPRRERGVPCAGCDGGAVRGVVRAGAGRGVLRAPVHRRAGPRLGRRQGRPARTRRSIPSSWRRAGR